jgi:hypothetical protein
MNQLFRPHRTVTAARLNLASPPTWARLGDSTRDVSDEWMTATATEDACTAFFDHADVWCEPDWNDRGGEWQVSAILQGVRVTSGTAGNWVNTYHDRAAVIALVGQAWVDGIENDQNRTENGL